MDPEDSHDSDESESSEQSVEESEMHEELEEEDSEAKADMTELRKQLSTMPFEELEKLKEKIGVKMYNEVLFGPKKAKEKKVTKTAFKRENKNRPQEVTSKKRPPKVRAVIQTKKKVHRDPRFDDLSGEFSETHFNKSYSFLSEIKQREKQKLLQKFHKEKDESKKKKLEHLIQKMDQEERLKKDKETKDAKKSVIKRQEKALVSDGKKPFYLKKSEQKKLELADKFRELKQKGKVDKYLGKKRKKNAQKDRKKLPFKQ